MEIGDLCNKRVVHDQDKIVPIDTNSDSQHLNKKFQFIKIHECKPHKGFKQTKVIANIYRSTARRT